MSPLEGRVCLYLGIQVVTGYGREGVSLFGNTGGKILNGH